MTLPIPDELAGFAELAGRLRNRFTVEELPASTYPSLLNELLKFLPIAIAPTVFGNGDVYRQDHPAAGIAIQAAVFVAICAYQAFLVWRVRGTSMLPFAKRLAWTNVVILVVMGLTIVGLQRLQA